MIIGQQWHHSLRCAHQCVGRDPLHLFADPDACHRRLVEPDDDVVEHHIGRGGQQHLQGGRQPDLQNAQRYRLLQGNVLRRQGDHGPAADPPQVKNEVNAGGAVREEGGDRRSPRQRLGDRQEIEYAADQSPQQNGNDLIALSFCFQHTQFPLCHFSAPDTRFLAKDPALWKQGGVFHIAGGEK